MFDSFSETTRGFLTAGAILAASLLAGFIVDRIILASIRKLAKTTQGKIDDIIVSALKNVGRWGCFLIGLYIALPFLPVPEHFDDEIKVATRLVVLVLSIVVTARFASGIAAQYAHRILPSSASLAKVIVNAAVFLVGALVVFQTMGIQITPLLTALGVGGLAVALALQDTLANFFAGIQLLANKQINPGDYIRLDTGQDGYVYDIGWRNTTMRMVNNNIVIVPNTKLSQAIVTNYSLETPDIALKVTVGVGYDSDLAHVERVTLEVAKALVDRFEMAVKEFEPVVRFQSFSDSSIQLNVVLRCRDYGDQFLLQHELIKDLHRRYASEGIEIPYPMRTVIMRNPAPVS